MTQGLSPALFSPALFRRAWVFVQAISPHQAFLPLLSRVPGIGSVLRPWLFLAEDARCSV